MALRSQYLCHCRQCFEIWCQPGSPGGNCNPDPNQTRVTIMISDVCQPCSPPGNNHIDLQALTFLKVVCDAKISCMAATAALCSEDSCAWARFYVRAITPYEKRVLLILRMLVAYHGEP